MNRTQISERNEYIDILKGLCILLVVVGHCIQIGSGQDYIDSLGYFNDGVFKIIYSFHMPLFALISGYLYYFSCTKRNTQEIIFHQLRGLLVPILSWSLTYLAFYFLVYRILSFSYAIKYIINNAWFLWGILICSLLTALIRSCKLDYPLTYGIVFIITLFLPDKFNLQLYSFIYPFFAFGYMLNKYKNNIKIYFKKVNRGGKKDQLNICTRIIILAILLFIYVILLRFYKFNSYIYNSGYSILHDVSKLKIDVYRCTIGFIGCALFCYLIYIIPLNKFVKNITARMGRNTLTIYLLSTMYINVLLSKLLQYFHYTPINKIEMYSVNILETIITIILCIFSGDIIKRYSILRLAFLGGRK